MIKIHSLFLHNYPYFVRHIFGKSVQLTEKVLSLRPF